MSLLSVNFQSLSFKINFYFAHTKVLIYLQNLDCRLRIKNLVTVLILIPEFKVVRH